MPSCKQDKSTALNATYEAEFADRLSDAHFIREVRLLYCSRCFGLFLISQSSVTGSSVCLLFVRLVLEVRGWLG